MSEKTITFATNCWEADWEVIIKSGGYLQKIKNLDYVNFNKKILIINNVNNPKLVLKEADKLINLGVLDEYYLVEENAKKVLEHFEIKKESFTDIGYYYSISPLLAIFFSDSEYILYNTADTILEPKKYNWVDMGINIIEDMSNKVVCVNPVWNDGYEEARHECVFKNGMENENWFFMPRFSDQCFLMPLKFLKKKIYNEKNEMADYFWPHNRSSNGTHINGNSFEKRVAAHMFNNNAITATSKHISYYHKSVRL